MNKYFPSFSKFFEILRLKFFSKPSFLIFLLLAIIVLMNIAGFIKFRWNDKDFDSYYGDYSMRSGSCVYSGLWIPSLNFSIKLSKTCGFI